MESREINFSVDSALLSELGEKLVGSAYLALLELIKNAYDADATEVVVKEHVCDGRTEICIVDNGSGMTFEQVKSYWMKIATANKVTNPVSKRYGRLKSGAKGIGRFSCRRLGTTLTLETSALSKSGRVVTTHVDIDWRCFHPGVDLDKILVTCWIDEFSNRKVGTELIIRDETRQLLSRADWNYIKRHCAILVSNRGVQREEYERDPGFNIILETSDGARNTCVNLRDEILDAGWGTVVGSVDSSGQVLLRLQAMGFEEGVVWRPQLRFPELKGVSLRIGVLVVDKKQIRNASILSLGALRTVLDEWGGVFVRYNGVRIPPYGENGDDWLQIDKDRGLRHAMSSEHDLITLASKLRGTEGNRYLLSLLSSRAYVGDVEIGSENEGFVIKTSREGFLESTSFESLRRFVRIAVDFATLYRDCYIEQMAEKQSLDQRKAFIEAIDANKSDSNESPLEIEKRAFDVLKNELYATKVDNRSNDSLCQRVDLLTKASDAIRSISELRQRELTQYRLIASTSTLLTIFAHDVRAYLGDITQAIEKLSKFTNGNILIEEVISSLMRNRDNFVRLVDMTLAVAVPGIDCHAEELSVRPRLERTINCFSSMCKNYSISVDLSAVPKIIRSRSMLESELLAIFVNIISNSIKATIASTVCHRKIRFEITKIGGGRLRILCLDNGIGVDVKKADRLFDYRIMDPEKILYNNLSNKINPGDAFLLGMGTGMGLSIVRSIVQRYNGSITFIMPPPQWSTALEICI